MDAAFHSAGARRAQTKLSEVADRLKVRRRTFANCDADFKLQVKSDAPRSRQCKARPAKAEGYLLKGNISSVEEAIAWTLLDILGKLEERVRTSDRKRQEIGLDATRVRHVDEVFC